MIDWSWELLSEPERVVLRRLAVHAEGCGLEAAEEVCAGDGVAPEDVLDLLVRLVDRSLVVAAEGRDGPRYRLLESVAAYCAERMRDAGEYERVRAGHLAYYTALAEQAEPGVRGHGQRVWLERLDAETANLRWALETAGEQGAGEHALRLVDALAWYWVLRGRLGEARRSTEAALAQDGGGPRLRAKVAVWHSGIVIMTGDGAGRAERIAAALKPYEDGLDGLDHLADPGNRGDPGALGRPDGLDHLVDPGDPRDGGRHGAPGHSGDPGGRAWAQWFLSHALGGTGDPTEGAELTGRALEGFLALGDRWGTAAALADRSVQRLLRGDLAGAEDDASRSTELFGEVGDACGQLWSVYPLASVAEIRGDYRRSGQLQRSGLRTAQEFGLSTQAADLLSGLGRTALLTGDLTRARDYHERSRRGAAELGFRAGEINAELGLGLGARREGLLDEAEDRLRTVLEWHRQVGLDGANALILAELGFIAELRGDAEKAMSLQEEGHATARTTGDPRAVALALEGLAGAHALAGSPARAALLLGTASAARASTGAPLPPAERADVDRITRTAREALAEGEFETEFETEFARGERLDAEAPLSRAASGA
ncbi:hypothetical protein OG883_23875 [Streptomyces sp. NBC_01142]|uniref:ATP-binding protein n=1 Tax=Streptomyces sp. NBC_01142 TaxID=2975865 RepID=UPI00224D0D7F|nr:hypothetical protein [Streptomyces sp. NBC_01142]MCX4822880.1 hypothetical protein [Streptomyces sp. NBC_01142]